MSRSSTIVLLGALLATAATPGVAVQQSDPLADSIDGLLSAAYAPGGPGAAIRVTKAGSVVLSKGYGLADVESKTPATTATPFRLASVTKVFTSAAVLLLAEEGRLALDDAVSKRLPEFTAAAPPLTVRHLLSHTSGVPEYLERPNSVAWAQQDYSVAQLVETVGSRPAAFAPGETSVYSNSNYILLGALVEKLSGQRFADFVEARFTRPLGLKHTACGGPWTATPGLATTYEPARDGNAPPDWSRLVPARPYARSALYAAGGCVSSVDDLAIVHDALMKGSVIGKTWLARSLAPMLLANGRPGTMSQGGWQTDPVAGRRAAALGGALPGVCTWLLTMPDEGISVILLTNRSPGEPRCGALATQIAALAVGG